MLQRIQTIYLTSVVILGIVFSFIPVLGFSFEGINYHMNAYHTVLIEDAGSKAVYRNMGVGTINGIVVVLALITIFLYKKRTIQIKLCRLNILLTALEIAAIAFYSDAAQKVIGAENSNKVEIHFAFGIIIPVITFVLNYLASKAIRKDEELVRAADRLR